ncbi:GLPGLI family protein [Corallibacter sp.]|uniref:GLPGLI family protein n=1 Tax=Corallibacter sp. TaxID=2038084 RepID=UPI003AB15C01
MRLLSIITILLLTLNLHSQNQKGIINYGHKKSTGMGAPIGIDYNANLVFSNKSSIYTYAKDSLEGGHINKDVVVEQGDKDKIFLMSKISNSRGFQYYIDNENKEMLSRDIGFNYVKEETPTINWEILEEKKSIGDFECLKAIGEFRGRIYTAWFTTSIPLPYGPWKIQGLPGLILEAYDTNKEVYFYFKSIKYPLESKIEINKPDPKTEAKQWISFLEYKKWLRRAYEAAVENGRMITEGIDSGISDDSKNSMGNSYIEIFDEEK